MIENENVSKCIYHPGDDEQVDKLNKEFQEFIARNHPSDVKDLFRIYLKDRDGTGLECSEKYCDFHTFPKVLKLHNLRIQTGNLQNFEGVCRCSFGIAYHMLGYSKGDMETEPSCYIDCLLDKPKINTVARTYLLELANKGYFDNIKCTSIDTVNEVLKDIGLQIEEL